MLVYDKILTNDEGRHLDRVSISPIEIAQREVGACACGACRINRPKFPMAQRNFIKSSSNTVLIDKAVTITQTTITKVST